MEQYTHTQRYIESKSVRRVVDCPPVVGRRAVLLRRVNVLVFVDVYAIFYVHHYTLFRRSITDGVYVCACIPGGKMLRG